MGRDSGGCAFDLKGLVGPVKLNGAGPFLSLIILDNVLPPCTWTQPILSGELYAGHTPDIQFSI